MDGKWERLGICNQEYTFRCLATRRSGLSSPPDYGAYSLQVIGIAKGLNYLHDEMDAVHSDIKGVSPPDMISQAPADLAKINVLISNSHPVRAVICDFGTSRIVNASLTLGRPSPSMSSTTRWLAFEAFHLEQASNEFVYTKKMDIWAFGMTIYVRALEVLHCRRTLSHSYCLSRNSIRVRDLVTNVVAIYKHRLQLCPADFRNLMATCPQVAGS